MNPAEWLQRSAERGPDRPALMLGNDILADYAGFRDRAFAAAQALATQGLRPGERVAVFAANSPDYLVALYAIWASGAVAVPINAKLHPREAAWIVTDAGAGLVLVDATHGQALAAACPDSRCLSLDGREWQAMQRGPLALPHLTGPQDLVWLFYTSGTTGKPKGVMLTSANLTSMTLGYLADVDAVTPGDAALYAAPMSHGAGLYNFVYVMQGARHVVPASDGFDAAEILALAPGLGDVCMFAAPTMVRRLVNAARASGNGGEGFRTIIYGGGPMYVADIIEAVEVLGPRFVQIYGQGECPMAISALSRAEVADRSYPDWRSRLGSVGRAQSAVRLRIADVEGRLLPQGEVGEILVQGLPVMAGYWRNPEASAATLRDGWLWTGDMGRIDQDGCLTLHDRSKDVIISGGTNIYPREIEEALLEHPAVLEVSVIGRADAEWGEVPVACIVAGPAQPTPAELDQHCLDRIARFKRPKEYVFLGSLPKNNYGKVLKTLLRETAI